jgi:hypothetical protein
MGSPIRFAVDRFVSSTAAAPSLTCDVVVAAVSRVSVKSGDMGGDCNLVLSLTVAQMEDDKSMTD